MWNELLNLFSSDDPMKSMGDDFMRMLAMTHEMAEVVRPHVFDHLITLEKRKLILEKDVEVNKLERSIRRQIVSHLTLHRDQIPYCLLLLMMVGHVERTGDYIKNVAQVEQLGGAAVPEGPLRDELSDLIAIAHRLFEGAPKLIADQDRDGATELVRVARNAKQRSDKLLVELSKSDLTPSQVTSMVLLTRFYRRITSHLRNILSSVVMPVHQVDFDPEDLADDEQ
jgi:phosphate uptake regulator